MTIQKIDKLKKINIISKITRFRNNNFSRTSLIITSSIRQQVKLKFLFVDATQLNSILITNYTNI